MAAARRCSAPIFVLSERVDMGGLTDKPGRGWTKIEIASKKAYGCGEHGQELLEGLTLYGRLSDVPVLNSSLAIRMSHKACWTFDAELELGNHRRGLRRNQMKASGVVQMADDPDLTVIVLVLFRDLRRRLDYYLVYDHISASLSMIKYLPEIYEDVSTMKPVSKRHGSDFELFYMSHQLYPAPHTVLCVCTPDTRANAASDGTGLWQIKKGCFEHEETEEFKADVAFSLQGKGFWADLSQGLMYCDLCTSDVVDFGFIGLPGECRLDLAQKEVNWDVFGDIIEVPMKLNRTMGCVGDSIWFVCIDRSAAYADDLVKIWTLDLSRGKLLNGEWERMAEDVPVSVLLGLDSFKVEGLLEGRPEFPVLMADGGLCVVLSDQSKFPRPLQGPLVEPICSFDVPHKKLLWHGLVHDYPFTNHVIIPSNFLQRRHDSRKRKVDEQSPAAGV
ncbi:hypothetical protein BAE44_0019499 [Dichanthelium oligosanthes]|uniref:DUF1618 domain-containing protein n=1 Tax=Dichanthelium oligosanthes TaxID=888268 RepID=A0A1E5V361_9POAL|nr:hypothetical protein BAE44_0019499 [Dichanthelium oligosanthes]